MFQTKDVQKIKSHILCQIKYFYRKSCRLWNNEEKYCRAGQMTIWPIRNACWIQKATNTHSGYVIIMAFPPQQWMHERASTLRYTYIDCLACYQMIWARQKVSLDVENTIRNERSSLDYCTVWESPSGRIALLSKFRIR